MALVGNRSDRFYWGIANLAGCIVCLPICWGMPAKDWAALKFGAAIGGAVLGVNSIRLIRQHIENAPIRAAWNESAVLVSSAWIEEIALANLPPRLQQQDLQQSMPIGGGEYYLPQLPQPEISKPDEEPSEKGSDRKMPNLSAYNAVLICGVPGAGKTTLSQQEVRKRLSLGHKVVVLDPHAAYGKWEGCEIIGGGMDYEAIDVKLKWLFAEVKERYRKTHCEPNPHLSPLTVVAEEFTRWSGKVKAASELFWTANTDIRKVEIFVLFVNHARTLVACGGAKGAATLRDENLLEVQLQGEMDEQTGRATPLFQALVKMPGKSLSERYLVPIDKVSDQLPAPVPSASQAEVGSAQNLPPPTPENLGSPYGMLPEAYLPIVAQILGEPGKQPLFSSAIELPHEEKLKIAKIIIAQNLGTEKLILCFWAVTSGGRNHYLYVEAKKMLNRLMEDSV